MAMYALLPMFSGRQLVAYAVWRTKGGKKIRSTAYWRFERDTISTRPVIWCAAIHFRHNGFRICLREDSSPRIFLPEAVWSATAHLRGRSMDVNGIRKARHSWICCRDFGVRRHTRFGAFAYRARSRTGGRSGKCFRTSLYHKFWLLRSVRRGAGSHRTLQKNVQEVLSKFQFKNRTAVATCALRSAARRDLDEASDGKLASQKTGDATTRLVIADRDRF
jgi:hypothetical protein